MVRGPSAPPAGRHCRAGAPARRAHRGFESTRKLVARLRPGPRRLPRWPLPAAGPRAAGRQQPVPRGASRHRRQRDGVGLGPRAARSGTPEVLSCRAWRTTRPAAAGRAAAAARRTASRASTSPWHLRTVARKCLEQDPPGPSARGGWRAPGGGLQTRPSSSGPAGAARARAELFQPESLRELGRRLRDGGRRGHHAGRPRRWRHRRGAPGPRPDGVQAEALEIYCTAPNASDEVKSCRGAAPLPARARRAQVAGAPGAAMCTRSKHAATDPQRTTQKTVWRG